MELWSAGAEGLGKARVIGSQDGGMTRYQVTLTEKGHLTARLEEGQADLRRCEGEHPA